MNLYRISDDVHQPRFAATFADARLVADNGYKTFDHDGDPVEIRFLKDDVWIEMVTTPTDLRTVVDLMNGIDDSVSVLRTWERTPRGGFKEVVGANSPVKRSPTAYDPRQNGNKKITLADVVRETLK